MLHVLAAAGAVLLCGAGYRARGGWHPFGPHLPEQAGRFLFWGTPCALAGFVAGLGWWALALAPLAWAGSTVGYPWGSMDVREPGRRLVNALGMALKGLLTVALMAALLGWRHGDWPGVLGAGAAFAALYWLAFGISRVVHLPVGFGGAPGKPLALQQWTEAAEFGCGIAIGIALVI